jgi:hypothetical protein
MLRMPLPMTLCIHDDISQKAIIFILTAMRIWNLTWRHNLPWSCQQPSRSSQMMSTCTHVITQEWLDV